MPCFSVLQRLSSNSPPFLFKSHIHRTALCRTPGVSENIQTFEAPERHNHLPLLPSSSCMNFHSSTLSTFLASLGIFRSPFLKTCAKNISCFFGKVPQCVYYLPTHQDHKLIYFLTVSEECLTVTATAQFHSLKYPKLLLADIY